MDLRRGGQTVGSHVEIESNDRIVSRLAEQDKVPWYRKPNLRQLYFLIALTCIGVEMTAGFDVSMMNGLQAVPSWLEYYGHPRSASLGLMSAVYPLGCIAAVPFVPSVVDKLGRRYSIFIGAVISIVGSILQGSALNFMMFILARFIVGFASVFGLVAASSLVGELSHPKERAVIGCLFISAYDLGAIAAAAVTLGTFAMTSNWGWRIPSLLQVVPSLLQISFIWFLPESPRWLVSMGRGDEAHAVLVKYHAEDDENSEFVMVEYAQIKETLEAELKSAQMNLKDVFSAPGMRKRVIIASVLAVSAQWCGVSLVSQYLAPVLDTIGIHDNRMKNIVNFAKTVWSLVNTTFLAFTVPRFPRRSVYLIGITSLLVIFVAWTTASAQYALTHDLVSSQVVLVLIFLYTPAYGMGFSALRYTFLVELFPFHARARGITIYQWWSRIAAFVSRFADPIGIEAIGWKYYVIYCLCISFQVVFIYFTFPETSGRTLEELTFLYEDDQDILRNSELEGLLEHGEITTHAAMEDD